MTTPVSVSFHATDLPAIEEAPGRIAVVVPEGGRLGQAARRVNRLTRGAVARAVASDRFAKLKDGQVLSLGFPVGLAAEAVDILRLPRRPDVDTARKGGAALARAAGGAETLVLADVTRRVAELALGFALRGYAFTDHKTADDKTRGALSIMGNEPDAAQSAWQSLSPLAEGVFLTRDLVSEPANVLTTTEFATRLEGLRDLGVEVEVLEEDALQELGMGALLCVGRGSSSPSKVVVMRWNGAGDDSAPLALIGKGVVFDTGGISLKPSLGMESMTMDMGGAGTVAGTLHALARRGARANVVGLVGLIENMPAGDAVRPGDVITSMKGDTVEVINTDAEGRLVLCDVMWYAQTRFKPAAMVDLATLTGACIVALGHENAAVFSNDDDLADGFLKAAGAEAEGAWRMPMGQAYDDLMKSTVADVKNSGGRAAGSITAAQFLRRFVQDGVPWVHLDIAGVAHVSRDLPLSPKGATGWGVLALNRLVADRFEKG
ncbi:leucyl aminopeptidase [Primorskyibacter marinus]|uniref:leucyl aminopeptidase n=1 Tax=Primorskyibacter marinus TaxID=1977320 RepID=UPI000E300951|nr:leucyl aminopeptidase [Primorskyibacter marinus]